MDCLAYNVPLGYSLYNRKYRKYWNFKKVWVPFVWLRGHSLIKRMFLKTCFQGGHLCRIMEDSR